MTSKAFAVVAYIRYLWKSGTRHAVHSPFVYKLVDDIFKNKEENLVFLKINELRKKLLQNSQLIEITDFGVGKSIKDFSIRLESVASLTHKSSVDKKFGRILFGLIQYFEPQTIIELGTSLGISTLYMAMANPAVRIFSIEGCTSKSEQAAINFKTLQVTNVIQHIGRFDIILPDLIKQAGKLDFAFIDGNHTHDATLANFEALLTIAHNDTIFVFDDIHWSAGMEKAWNEISDHKHVTVSIDLFRMGIVFLRKELSRQKFVIRL